MNEEIEILNARRLLSLGLSQEDIDLGKRAGSASFDFSSSSLFHSFLTGKTPPADEPRARAFFSACENLSGIQREKISKIARSCDSVTKPAKLGSCLAEARMIFGTLAPDFAACCLNSRLTNLRARRVALDPPLIAAFEASEFACFLLLAKAAKKCSKLLAIGCVGRVCFEPDPKFLDYLLSQGFPAQGLSFGDSHPLSLACRQWNRNSNAAFDCARLLLDAGADPNLPSCRGPSPRSPFSEALENSLDICHLLLERGADPLAHPETNPDLVAIGKHSPEIAARCLSLSEARELAGMPAPAPSAKRPAL